MHRIRIISILTIIFLLTVLFPALALSAGNKYPDTLIAVEEKEKEEIEEEKPQTEISGTMQWELEGDFTLDKAWIDRTYQDRKSAFQKDNKIDLGEAPSYSYSKGVLTFATNNGRGEITTKASFPFPQTIRSDEDFSIKAELANTRNSKNQTRAFDSQPYIYGEIQIGMQYCDGKGDPIPDGHIYFSATDVAREETKLSQLFTANIESKLFREYEQYNQKIIPRSDGRKLVITIGWHSQSQNYVCQLTGVYKLK